MENIKSKCNSIIFLKNVSGKQDNSALAPHYCTDIFLINDIKKHEISY